jgi:outer membrane protein assembly factor BamD
MRPYYALVVLLLSVPVLIGCSGSDATSEPTAEERFHTAMEEYNDEDYLEALTEFDVIRLQFPGSPVSDSARYFAGMARFKREEYLLASYEFNQVRQGGPRSGLLADAQYMYALCYVRLSPDVPLDQTYTYRAIDAVQTFIELYPDHPKVPEAEEYLTEMFNKLAEKEYNTGVLYVKMENPDAALVYFDTVIDKYYSTPYADDAMYRKIDILVKQRKTAEANALIKTFLDKYPDSPYREDIIDLRRSASLSSSQ